MYTYGGSRQEVAPVYSSSPRKLLGRKPKRQFGNRELDNTRVFCSSSSEKIFRKDAKTCKVILTHGLRMKAGLSTWIFKYTLIYAYFFTYFLCLCGPSAHLLVAFSLLFHFEHHSLDEVCKG